MAGQTVKGGYWFKDSGLALNDIDSTLFTHLFCAFADLNPQTNQLIIKPEEQDSFRQFTSTVQRKNPSVKTLLSIAGGSANQTDYGIMASQPNSRKSFIDSSISLARTLGFHGVDLDWENQERADDMTNLGMLLNEWRIAINTEAGTSGEAALLFTAAVARSPRVNNLNYPVQSVARNLDWINVMAYDFYDPNRSPSLTNSHAQLKDPEKNVSGSDGITAWINSDVQPRKMVLGVPFYGYAWQLVDPNVHGLRAPANGKSDVGAANDGSMTYVRIKDYIAKNSARTVSNETIVGDYCYSGNTWISY